jgi:hypothetical protein
VSVEGIETEKKFLNGMNRTAFAQLGHEGEQSFTLQAAILKTHHFQLPLLPQKVS